MRPAPLGRCWTARRDSTPKQRKRTVNDALHTPFLHRSQLAEIIDRHPTHPGAKLLRPFVDTTDGPTRSGWEDEFPAFCKQFGLPRPRVNTIVCGFEVDAYFEAEKLIVELDSYEFHHDRDAFETDRDRDADNPGRRTSHRTRHLGTNRTPLRPRRRTPANNPGPTPGVEWRRTVLAQRRA